MVAAEYVLDLLCIYIYETRVLFPCTMRSGLMYRQDILQALIYICVPTDLKDHEISINYTDSQSMSSFSYSWISIPIRELRITAGR